MDYQEAIKEAEIQIDMYESMILYNKDFEPKNDNSNYERKLDFLKTVISSMQELQIYKDNEKRNLARTNRLINECVYRHENGNCLKVGGFCTSVPLSHCQRYKDWYTDYRAYKKLGTLEEVREAVEKQKAKKPNNHVFIRDFHGRKFDKRGNCPICGCKDLSARQTDYCIACGQRIDWSEEE